jgi:hypothetical protein
MQRIVTAIFALLLLAGAAGPAPVSRAYAKSTSAAIVWIARESVEQRAAQQPPLPKPAPPAAAYRSRSVGATLDAQRFQRPPPAAL